MRYTETQRVVFAIFHHIMKAPVAGAFVFLISMVEYATAEGVRNVFDCTIITSSKFLQCIRTF